MKLGKSSAPKDFPFTLGGTIMNLSWQRRIIYFVVLLFALTDCNVFYKAAQKKAVVFVWDKVGAAMDRWGENIKSLKDSHENTIENMNRFHSAFYRELSDIDVSDCPDDFRAQYRRLLMAVNQMSQSKNVEGNKSRVDEFQSELEEFVAITKKYL